MGRSFVEGVGTREGKITRDSVRDLVALCQQERFFALELTCSVTVMDAPSTTLRLTLGDRSREVLNRSPGGPSDVFPEENAHIPVHQALDRIANAIDQAVNIDQWIGIEDQRRALFKNSKDGRLLPAENDSNSGDRSVADLQNEELARVSALFEEAKELAGRSPASDHEALAAYAKAEDEAVKGLDKATKMHQATQDRFTMLLKDIIRESDKFVSSVFTEKVIEATPWQDLLATDQERHWQHYNLQQFRLDGNGIQILGPASNATETGLIVFPDTGGFRDFELELGFTLRGKIDCVLRLGRRLDNTQERLTLSTNGQEPLVENRSYLLQAKFIGSSLTEILTPHDAGSSNTTTSWFMSRKGGFGIQVSEGTELKITWLRVRRLRDA